MVQDLTHRMGKFFEQEADHAFARAQSASRSPKSRGRKPPSPKKDNFMLHSPARGRSLNHSKDGRVSRNLIPITTSNMSPESKVKGNQFVLQLGNIQKDLEVQGAHLEMVQNQIVAPQKETVSQKEALN